MITLLTVVDRHRHDLLPQFVTHYRAIGVDRFLLTCHLDPALPEPDRWEVLSSMASILLELGIHEMYAMEKPHDAMINLTHRAALRDAHCAPTDWCVWADVDEFQEYSVPLPRIVESCDRRGDKAVRGWFLDHFATHGRLAPFDPWQSIWDQFPQTGHITRDLLQGVDTKIVLCRADVTPVPGCHAIADPLTGHWAPGTTGGVPTAPDRAIVHHFKWDAAVLKRLRYRLSDDWKTRCPWWVETQRLFDHIEAHGNLVPPDETAPVPVESFA